MFRRVLFEHVDAFEAHGWAPAVTDVDAMGVDPFAGGTQMAVLLRTEDMGMDEREREDLIRGIVDTLRTLERDEIHLIELITTRIRHGYAQYGVLDIKGNAKDWRREASEELLDACAYLAMQVIREGT